MRIGTPAEICDSIEARVKTAYKDPVSIQRMTHLAEVVGFAAKEFGEFTTAKRTKWGKTDHRPQNPCRRLASN